MVLKYFLNKLLRLSSSVDVDAPADCVAGAGCSVGGLGAGLAMAAPEDGTRQCSGRRGRGEEAGLGAQDSDISESEEEEEDEAELANLGEEEGEECDRAKITKMIRWGWLDQAKLLMTCMAWPANKVTANIA